MAQPSAGAMLDGITIQHAGELLLDVATTADVRRNNATTYIRSAEDLAFALVYFDHLVISDRRMAWQQGQSPGDALLARFPDLVKEIPVAAAFTAADLLGMSEFRDRIAKDFASLPRALDLGTTFFRSYMRREAQVYLGQHDSLSDPELPPDEYVYGVFYGSAAGDAGTAPRTFYADRQLQDLISPSATETLVSFIPEETRFAACTAALREFASRSMLTHVTTLRWREYLARSTYEAVSPIPHCTRAAILQAGIEQDSPEWFETQRALVVPALAMAVQTRPRNRDELIDRIVEVRDMRPVPQIRKAVIEYMTEDRPAQKRKLLAEMRRGLSLYSAGTPDEVLTSPVLSQITFTAGVPGMSAEVKGEHHRGSRRPDPVLSRGRVPEARRPCPGDSRCRAEQAVPGARLFRPNWRLRWRNRRSW